MTIDRSHRDKTMVPDTEREAQDRKSKFLKYQDKNGDGMPDVCVESIRPSPVCLDCIPNPYSLISNWRERDETEPILNQKNCKYQITIPTRHTTTGYEEGMTEEEAAAALEAIYTEYAPSAVQILLEEFQKDDSAETIASVLAVTDFTDFHLEAREGSRLLLLFSVDFEYIFYLPEIEVETEDDEEPEEPDDIKVKFTAGGMNATSIKLEKGMNLYGRYLKVFRSTEGGNLKFKEDDRLFNLGAYGSDALLGTSQITHVMTNLDSWLDSRGYTMSFGFWDFFSSNDQITNLIMVFTGDYRIKLMKVYTEGCGDRPAAVYKYNRLKSLRNRRGWRDRTAVAYVAQMNAMVAEMSARSPRPWTDFIVDYTYPEIYVHKPDESVGENTIMSCVSQKLENEFIDLGQDILDDVFSIGDAIAYAFHKKLCRTDPDQVNKDLAEMGLNSSQPIKDIWNTQSMAQMQSFFTVDEKDPIFVNMCKRALLYKGFGGSSAKQLDQLYKHGLGPLKICGLFDLLFEALECLMKGLALDEAMGRIVLAALNAMGVEDFGNLFIGLPPDKRAELDELVKKNLKSGKAFDAMNAEGEGGAESAPLMGSIDFVRPWENQGFVDHQNKISKEENFGAAVPSKNKSISNYDPTLERRTLGQKLRGPSEQDKQGLDPQSVFDAYILAMIEVYSDNMLALLDHLSNFPGAQLISAVISMLDCPSPPLFNPGIMDFIKSLGLPFCRNHQDIVAIRIENPFAAWPKLTDILWWIFLIVRYLIIQLIMKILLAILAKICEIIGNAICKALETVGAVAGSLPGILSGQVNVLDVIRDTICGPNASDEDVENTIVDLVAQLGVGGAALADRDRAINFFADAINTMTREEAMEAFIEGPSPTTAQLIDNLIEHDYQDYREAFPTTDSIGNFFRNVGNLIDPQVKSDLRDILSAVPEELNLPANPSMCATPEEIELFEQARCALLEGRMSPEQCDAMNESAKLQLLEDLDDVGKMIHEGIPTIIEANMPPVFSDPGCNNGLLPHEPEEAMQVATMALSGDLEKIEVAYAEDMMGDGGSFSFFPKQKDWGFLNMALSDTYGNPFTVHNQKTMNDFRFVDYYGQPEFNDMSDFPAVPSNPFLLPVWIIEVIAFVTLVFPIEMFIKLIQMLFMADKKGAFPEYVAPFLMGQFKNDSSVTGIIKGDGADDLGPVDLWNAGSLQFQSNNRPQKRTKFWRTFDSLGFIWRFLFISDTDVELVDMPNFGYNTKYSVDYGSERVAIVRQPRKKTPDIFLNYFDNAKGYRTRGSSGFDYGFTVRAYYSDIIQKDNGYINRPDDNIRIEVETALNWGSYSMQSAILAATGEELSADDLPDDAVSRSRRFEFLASDGGFENLSFQNYPNLNLCFERQTSYSPPVGALRDITGGELSLGQAQDLYNAVNKAMYHKFAEDIGNNKKGWQYGYTPDGFGSREAQLGVTADAELANLNEDYSVGDFIPYWNLMVPEYDDDGNKTNGSKRVENEDGVLGISKDMHDNNKAGTPEATRIFYLDPNSYGGSYANPPVYVKPIPADGWLGMVDILFPEYSPCEPKSQGIIGFGDIKQYIDASYSRIPEDKRLQGNEDCIFEAPFNRILTRPSKAGIRGLIMAAIRIYGSLHMTKSLATFSQFAPDFKANYSKIYAAYIVERMKESMMDAGGNFFNSFNDTEFWYAFLEQSVQFYTDRLNDDTDETITPDSVPTPVIEAIEVMDELQANYTYPRDFDDYNNDDYGTFESMKSFRESKNLEAVKSVESSAKLVLQELVQEQLVEIGKRFIHNAEIGGLSPTVYNMDYYFMETFCYNGGASPLKLQGNFIEKPMAGGGLGQGDNLYTTGDLLALPSGQPYTGEYHTHMDVDGQQIYMVGPTHVAEEHDRLIPFARALEVHSAKSTIEDGITRIDENPIGDVGYDKPTEPTPVEAGQQFYLRKYILVGGVEYENDLAVSEIRGRHTGNLTDYPDLAGTLQLVIDPETGKPTGIGGEIGVQYALEFGIKNGGIPITTVTIGALDLPVSKFEGISANSKILLCLINQLREDEQFRLTVDYIFSMKKALATLAIYNDLGILPSIGETTVRQGDMTGGGLLDIFNGEGGEYLKPGVRADSWIVDTSEYPPKTVIEKNYTVGWASEDDRNGLFSSFGYIDFDEWDQVTMRKSARRLKDLFKPYYQNRKFHVHDSDGPSPGEQIISNITERFRFNPAPRILPSSRRKYVRSNPFDGNGNMCAKKK